MCVLLNFVIFLNSENSSTYFKASCISLQKILIDEMSLSNGICADREQAKAFLFSQKEERKCSDSSVVRVDFYDL